MKILNLKAENIKKLVAVDITPNGDTVVISGKNGAGKSSVLDSIYWALAGSKHIDAMPIRQGEEKGSIRLDLGKYVVERRFTEKSSYLTVTAKDGARYPSPQDLLNEMTASITFDPLEFSRLKPQEQYDALRGLVKIDADIEALDAQNEKDFDNRTDVNRQIKALDAQIEGIKAKIPDGTPDEPIDVMDLSNKINGEKDKIRTHGNYCERIANADKAIADTESEIEALSKKLDGYRKARLDIASAKSEITLVDAAVVQDWQDRLEKSQETNQAVSLKADMLEKRSTLDDLIKKSEGLTKAIKDRELEKAQAIADAEMPIPGLTLANGVVFYEGVPFSQASSAQQLRVSTAIAMAMNPELRVIRIKDGSLLDREGMDMIKSMAKDKDFQIWIERVADDDPVAIVIEDGQVKQSEMSEAA
ncbi:AAA family ATPase [Micavibrio aeruginosavorus]|uniref:Rad50/SbcC-type AAA domain-containing protein n=1 Tax=Micavibrio aeruginosavorus (strain ARL-13) TaxID=856793 RepID=G2KMZ4_MICAA|nr:AAA family ATPase [Micavibrio aeruginosavorus]AEP08926.1 putative uncharacterized protein [Micavibrio aeruginosavorus ARL-13]